MKIIKFLKIISFMVFSLILIPLSIADGSERNFEEEYFNPVYENINDEEISINSTVLANDYVVNEALSIEEAAKYMCEKMISREPVITVTVNMSYYSGMAQEVFEKAVIHNENGNSSAGDYLFAHFKSYRASIVSNSTSSTLTFNMNYLSTYDEEVLVNRKVKEVLDYLNVYSNDTYTKIKAVHDYIVTNIDYDYSLTKFSSYNAIIDESVVCQGFASLTYKMLMELGVDVRFITGKSNGEAHGWNIVKIGSLWYNLDNTWDENHTTNDNISYTYFLKNTAEFINHLRDEKYANEEFNKVHTMSESSYTYGMIENNYYNLTVGELHKNAYEATIEAIELKTQKSINLARAKSEAFRAKVGTHPDLSTWSTLLDQVQHPIYVQIVDKLLELQEIIAIGREHEIIQNDVNILRNLMENDQDDDSDNIPDEYFIAPQYGWCEQVDKIQNVLINRLVTAIDSYNINKTEANKLFVKSIVDDIKTSVRREMSKWAETMWQSIQ